VISTPRLIGINDKKYAESQKIIESPNTGNTITTEGKNQLTGAESVIKDKKRQFLDTEVDTAMVLLFVPMSVSRQRRSTDISGTIVFFFVHGLRLCVGPMLIAIEVNTNLDMSEARRKQFLSYTKGQKKYVRKSRVVRKKYGYRLEILNDMIDFARSQGHHLSAAKNAKKCGAALL